MATSLASRSLRQCRRLARSRTTPQCSVRARWCVDARYGRKQDATILLQEWVRDVGSQAGLSSSNCRISAGAVGVPESKLELEVTLDDLASWEQFLLRIPAQEHRAWSQRAQNVIMDGSPRWEIYRACAVMADSPSPQAALPAASALTTSSRAPARPPQEVQAMAPSVEIIETVEDAEIILDWKGDPMKLNPGDKLPFKFL